MKHDSTVNKAIYYIETNLERPLTLEEIASHGDHEKLPFLYLEEE